ncbi:MAG TPA: hypothetical protein VEJ18_04150, partial [Planctomycetota bacterium]|nr:hypothetical protein [Planctomycetota bacterium]
PKPLLGKHVYELRVASDRLDLKKARGTLRLEPAQGVPILHSLHYENPAVPETAPSDASTRTLPLGSHGPTVTLLIFRPSTEFIAAAGRKTPPAPATAGRGYFFVDLLFDRPDAQFKALLTLEVDGRVHSAEFDYPWADARREAK